MSLRISSTEHRESSLPIVLRAAYRQKGLPEEIAQQRAEKIGWWQSRAGSSEHLLQQINQSPDCLTPATHEVLRQRFALQQKLDQPDNPANLAIIGSGPAALETIVAAVNDGRETVDQLFGGGGVKIITKENTLGAGALRRYANTPFPSNSPAADFLEGYPTDGPLGNLRELPEAKKVTSFGSNTLEFGYVADLLDAVGERVRRNLIDSHANSEFIPEAEVTHLQQTGSRNVDVHTLSNTVVDGFTSQTALLATGGVSQAIPPQLSKYKDKIIPCDDLHSSLATLDAALQDAQSKPLVIVGGSHSVWSACLALINRAEELNISLPEKSIRVIHRRPVKEYYPSIEQARSVGYTDFSEADTEDHNGVQVVNRWNGVRNGPRDLRRKVVQGKEQRIASELIPNIADADETFARASNIVLATGYAANAVPIFNKDGTRSGPTLTEKGTVDVTPYRNVQTEHGPLQHVFAAGLGHATLHKTGAPILGVNTVRLLDGPIIISEVRKRIQKATV